MHFESLKFIRFLRFREEIASEDQRIRLGLARNSAIRDLRAGNG